MDHDFSDRGVLIRTDDAWAARPAGARAVVVHPRDMAWLEPEHLPISVFIEIHLTNEGLQPTASRIMRRRASAGGLDANAMEVHGFKAVRFEWTDGVFDIESDFVAVQKGRILEITYAAEPERIDGKVRQHRELARTLGRFIDIDFLVKHAARG